MWARRGVLLIFSAQRASFAGPEVTRAVYFPLEAGEVKAGTWKPLGTVKVQPQYISRTWEQFVCVTLKGQRWYSMIYIPERGFLNFCSFPFALRAWQEEAGVGSCSFSVPI